MQETTTLRITTQIALRFVDILKRDTSPECWEEICRLNAAEPAGSLICHSHDFMDANEVMMEAYEEVTGSEPCMQWRGCVVIWNDAWAIAWSIMRHEHSKPA